MEINFHLKSLDASGTDFVTRTSKREAAASQDEVAFENSRALTSALESTPAVRDEVVRRAAELIGDVHYPPPETIRMISHLLAIKIHTDGEQL